jgi:hypothetical protein
VEGAGDAGAGLEVAAEAELAAEADAGKLGGGVWLELSLPAGDVAGVGGGEAGAADRETEENA